MKKILIILTILISTMLVSDCKKEEGTSIGGGMASVDDSTSQKNVVSIAKGSKDHTTLVAAVAAADLVDSLANPGPFTVFAPTNAAFDKLPKGTVEGLLKPDKIEDLKNILEYHVIVGTFKQESFQDGQVIGMANGGNITLSVKGGKVLINGESQIVASVPASNGIVHVVDSVLLPK
ncbi:MAG TPA: fasciclin domain-containing protein [Leptospiraceae bacterium]|nr:fasciclin domain-containing protein [Leptospiraceae bacterium]HNA05837.1 fasciclin domain-containing protein [Leptospiraceae bacterium]HNC56766.1 fasciclin domain-containing protein [Leptospiraceae bacterium]HNE08242.1 fasciclin domain-containing protein [Leptospiraceae bacterium]HNG99239.1 fasciclin domain-containing protein [Leptospiraceae bacterium]